MKEFPGRLFSKKFPFFAGISVAALLLLRGIIFFYLSAPSAVARLQADPQAVRGLDDRAVAGRRDPSPTEGILKEGNRVFPSSHGHRLEEKLSEQDVLEAAILAGEYLKRNVSANGRFNYIYDPRTDRVSKKYNILRHAGTAYSMLELYEWTEDETLLAAAVKALEYLAGSIQDVSFAGGVYKFVVEGKVVKLGGIALAAIALAQYATVTGDDRWRPLLRELGRGIVAVQNEEGKFIHEFNFPEGTPRDFDSLYYPGEALLALVRIYALDRDALWLDAAAKGAKYLIQGRDKDKADDDLPHDHWLLYALNELYRFRPEPFYFTHAQRIAQAIMRAQWIDAPFEEWNGGYYSPPRTTPAATRSEALCSFYFLAEYAGETAILEPVRQAIERGLQYQLRLQFREEISLPYPNPSRVRGGFPRSLTNPEIRIDYVQHNVSSFLLYLRIKASEEKLSVP